MFSEKIKNAYVRDLRKDLLNDENLELFEYDQHPFCHDNIDFIIPNNEMSVLFFSENPASVHDTISGLECDAGGYVNTRSHIDDMIKAQLVFEAMDDDGSYIGNVIISRPYEFVSGDSTVFILADGTEVGKIRIDKNMVSWEYPNGIGATDLGMSKAIIDVAESLKMNLQEITDFFNAVDKVSQISATGRMSILSKLNFGAK